jgi:hypothetical protein
MNFKPTKQELILVIMAILMGGLLRMSRTERLAVEHFDEGVYSSGIWYEDAQGNGYPMRHLYAPPLLPNLITAIAAIPGTQNVAPFAPAMLFGCLTVVVLWWMGRAWFGSNAGLVIVFLVAFSDFHILFSRMAMTDVPALFWICLAVAVASNGLQKQSVRLMMLAGLCTGLAWWTKYTGWLPLAIMCSGSGCWWLLEGRRRVSAVTILKLMAAMSLVAVVCWLPVLWLLQEHGGYAAVKQNHSGYSLGFDGWQDRLADHMVYHFRLDSWFGAAALGVGMLVAATQRWYLLVRSTWNDPRSLPASNFPSPAILAKFVIAAIALATMALGVGTIGLLACIGIGGIAGMFLWPMLSDLYTRRLSSDLSPPSESAAPYTDADLRSAPTIDPTLGVCLVAAWFAGMLLMTPTYQSYPRLSLPLVAAIWLAAAGGLAWWIEATLNVARRGGEVASHWGLVLARRSAAGLLMVAMGLTIFGAASLQPSWIWQDRTSLRDASWAIGVAVYGHASGTYEKTKTPMFLDESGIIHPDAEDEYDENRELMRQPTAIESMMATVAEKADTSKSLTPPELPVCVVYGFGEPAVLSHLSAAGLNVSAVQDLDFPHATWKGDPVATYLVLGPHALRTPGLLYDWTVQQNRFEHVDDFYFAPSEILLFNLFSPRWISQHEEVAVQKLELYRLK